MAEDSSKRVRWLAAIAATALAGCVYDSTDPCGPNMRYERASGVCVCADNAVVDGFGCTACTADEIVVGSVCACAPGEAKDLRNVCATVPGLGTTCDAADPCTDSTYDYCAVRKGAGACTERCTVDTDCPDTYVCAVWEATPSCRVYTGYGASCTIPSDCEDFDASSCLGGYCVVQGCTLGVDDCPRDTQCCDFSSFGVGTVCAPATECP